jgi:fatty-acyl-CoA synthase
VTELNFAAVHEAVATAVPDRECLVWRDRRLDWAEVTERSRRLANWLLDRGLGRRRALRECRPWESPHHHVALYLHNCPEYLEAMLGAFKATAAPVNINYRYVADELVHVLDDAGAAVLVFHRRFGPTVAEVLPRLRCRPALLWVDDDSRASLVPDAVYYEDALATASPDRPAVDWSPEDLYVLYTGGTTGLPKGVLWRQTDFLAACLGVVGPLDELVDRAARRPLRVLAAPPFMHGAAHWNALSAWAAGGTVVIQDRTDHFDPADLLRTCAREQVSSLLVVGDAFARPLLDELRTGGHDLSSLRFLLTGGAILSAGTKGELLARLPRLRVVDILGSSESGRQGVQTLSSQDEAATGRFVPSPTAAVLAADRSRLLGPGEDEVGWLAKREPVPRGYLGDPAKTEATFPTIGGQRYAVAGDRARIAADGQIELHGRDSVTINTGGEKVFAEEVELALKHHPEVFDAVVVGRPHPRFGQEVVALVQLRPGGSADDGDLRAACTAHLAGYKLPRAFVRVDRIERGPAGKPDYAWARARVAPVDNS